MQTRQALSSSLAGRSFPDVLMRMAAAVLCRVLGHPAYGEIIVDLPVGGRRVFSGPGPGPRAHVRIHRWRALARAVFGGPTAIAEGYIAGDWSSPDLATLLTLVARSRKSSQIVRGLPALRWWLRLRHALNRNTRRGSRRNISAHYDLGNEFYRRWLDDGMSYSSALFSSPHMSLAQAQDAKLDRVADMLQLRGVQEVLEIGCGWGSLAERLLERHDCRLTGITLSRQQLAYAQTRLRAKIQDGRCEFRLQDYRDVAGTFDRIVSIEMLEAVGESYWPTYFRTLRARLRAGGIAVLQVITIDEAIFPDYRRRPDFIQRHVFPGGMLPTRAIIEREAARAGLELTATEFFGDSYARTLEHWNARFQRAWPAIAGPDFDGRFKRTWEYYLAYCQAGFLSGALNVGLYKLTRGGGPGGGSET